MESDNAQSEYSQTPMTGSVKVPCKNKDCGGVVESGFVWNMEDWVNIFISEPRLCLYCKQKNQYSREDVLTFPSSS